MSLATSLGGGGSGQSEKERKGGLKCSTHGVAIRGGFTRQTGSETIIGTSPPMAPPWDREPQRRVPWTKPVSEVSGWIGSGVALQQLPSAQEQTGDPVQAHTLLGSLEDRGAKGNQNAPLAMMKAIKSAIARPRHLKEASMNLSDVILGGSWVWDRQGRISA